MRQITVEIVYATPSSQWLRELQVPLGTDVGELLELSGVLNEFSELKDQVDLKLGIFSKRVDQEEILKQGDRVEIYRELTADPKEVRRQLAKLGKVMGAK
jgi:putative ubiquitin-RnfH superfamily antitoxin RatB of RatAB toxin-antitoxin module